MGKSRFKLHAALSHRLREFSKNLDFFHALYSEFTIGFLLDEGIANQETNLSNYSLLYLFHNRIDFSSYLFVFLIYSCKMIRKMIIHSFCLVKITLCRVKKALMRSKRLPLPLKNVILPSANNHSPYPHRNKIHQMQVLVMSEYLVSRTLITDLMRQCVGQTVPVTTSVAIGEEPCGGFLCPGNSCRRLLGISPAQGLFSLVHVLARTACDPQSVLLPAIKLDPAWSSYLDRQQVWGLTVVEL